MVNSKDRYSFLKIPIDGEVNISNVSIILPALVTNGIGAAARKDTILQTTLPSKVLSTVNDTADWDHISSGFDTKEEYLAFAQDAVSKVTDDRPLVLRIQDTLGDTAEGY